MRKVIGIGETLLDIIFKDNKPVEAVPGGSTFNAIVSLGRVGANAFFVTEIGDDHVGALVRSFLSSNNVCTDYVLERKGWKSPVSLAFLDSDNNANYTFYRDPNADPVDIPLPDINPDDIVLFGSFYAVSPATRARVIALLERARDCGAIIYYDVNFRPSHRGDVMKVTPTSLRTSSSPISCVALATTSRCFTRRIPPSVSTVPRPPSTVLDSSTPTALVP